jgi:cell division protein FtsQ
MPRRSAAATEAQASTPGTWSRRFALAWNSTVGIVVFFGFVWLWWQADQMLVSDPRFFLTGPPEPGIPSETFQVQGVARASEEQISDAFSRDFGRSIYLCPIEERRRRLLAIDWVRDASVSRVWPNGLVVRITERTPVAFAQTPTRSGVTLFSLIDADGVLLDPQRAGKLELPVLVGIKQGENEAQRRERVKRFLRLQSELGAHMKRVSEIDVSDIDNLRVTQPFEDRAVTLLLGNQKYLTRYENFVNNQAEIRRRLPGATILDLRLRDRIMAVSSPVVEEKKK